MRDLLRDALYQRGQYDPNRKPTNDELRAYRDSLLRREREVQERAELEDEIALLTSRTQKPTTCGAPSAGGVQTSDPEPFDTAGLVAWQAVMIECWPEISKAYKGKSTARNAMKWIKDHGPRTVIPVKQPDSYVLHWIDLSGNPQTVALKSIQSRISEWRGAGIIPPEK